MPSSLGPAEIIVILVVALIVLGPKRLPEAGRQVGKALSEIRRWTSEVKSEMTSAFDADQAKAQQPPAAASPGAPPAADVVVRTPMEPAQPQPSAAAPAQPAQVVQPAVVEPELEPAAEAEPAPERPESPPQL